MDFETSECYISCHSPSSKSNYLVYEYKSVLDLYALSSQNALSNIRARKIASVGYVSVSAFQEEMKHVYYSEQNLQISGTVCEILVDLFGLKICKWLEHAV